MNISNHDLGSIPESKTETSLLSIAMERPRSPASYPLTQKNSVPVLFGATNAHCIPLTLPLKQTPICNSMTSGLAPKLPTDSSEGSSTPSEAFKQGRVISTTKRSQFTPIVALNPHHTSTPLQTRPSVYLSSFPTRSYSFTEPPKSRTGIVGGIGCGASGLYLTQNNLSLDYRKSSRKTLCHVTKSSGKPIEMQYRILGKSGLQLSCVGLGTFATFANQIDDGVAEKLVHTAYEAGVNYFDTSEMYAGGKAERVLGDILKRSGWRRSSYVIATKLYWGGKSITECGLSRKHIIEGLEASLSRLQLDYVDIVYANKSDVNTPMEEIVRGFSWLIERGRAFYWGTCKWSGSEIMEAFCVARQFNLVPPLCDQLEYHMFHRHATETQMPELYHKIGVGSITRSPLCGGVLTNKYKNGLVPYGSRSGLKGFSQLKNKVVHSPLEDGIQQSKLDELQSLADRIGCTLAQLAIGWCLKNEGISCVLLGASTVDQLTEGIASLKVTSLLTPNVLNEIEILLGNRPKESRLFEQYLYMYTNNGPLS
ncbi:voltage-gated potassium channel subunit beta-2-like [Symsagittifera roscoffensis]|uniref:voltage-gated potassium channel subunit beta-2-like n=1 Tax=Symsagittifera roscoffensis TaxID=84072 RepID=UPI00307CAE41